MPMEYVSDDTVVREGESLTSEQDGVLDLEELGDGSDKRHGAGGEWMHAHNLLRG